MSPVKFVVVGASLGGLSAVRTLLGSLPPGFGPALAVVQHRRADADSRLPDLLAAACVLPVREPEDKEVVCPGHVYLAPANYHLMVDAGVFWLTVDAPVSYARPSIDVLFESAADCFGPALVAVVLTGSSDDGAAGSRAIKRAGGTVLVQDPRSAESPTLPSATIASTPVDAVLALPALANHLVDLVRSRAAPADLGDRGRPGG